MKRLSIMSLAALAAFVASAAEVVVYSPYDKDGFTIKAPSGTYHYDKSFTGRRAVVTIPDQTNAVLEAWTGSGGYTSADQAYGTNVGRDTLALRLSYGSTVTPRIFFKSSAQGEPTALAATTAENADSDRAKTIGGYCGWMRAQIEDQDYVSDSDLSNSLSEINWVYTNRVRVAAIDMQTPQPTHVRIVRWAVDGEPVYRIGVEPEVVFDKKMTLANRAYLTEADILADGGFDLDWDKMKTDVVDLAGAGSGGANLSITNVGYLVVIGDGRTYWNYSIGEKDDKDAPVVLDRVIERRFALAQDVAVPFSPGDADSVVHASHPTFKWSIRDEDDADYDGSTAFCIQILDRTGTTVVWDSGTQFLPPRDSYGRYSWEAPAYVGEDLQKSVNYQWRVSVMNAKFPTPNWSKARKKVFRLEPDARSGSLDVCVRYFGSKAGVLDQGAVRVEAFESPDFTGLPVARTTIPTSEYDAIASSNATLVAQASLSGLPYGRYYVRAYIDSNSYGTKKTLDVWESRGYCSTSETSRPKAMAVGGTSQGGLCTIYVKDVDTNGNGIADAFEMYANGGVLDNGTENYDEYVE